MTYSAVPTKATGDLLAASDWNTYVRDNLADHEARITANSFSGAVVTRATDQTIANAASTLITWTAETTDQGGWIAVSSNTFTVPAGAIPPGYTSITVSLSVSVYWASNGSGSRGLGIQKNGTEYAADTRAAVTGDMGITLHAPDVIAVAGDTFAVSVLQDSGGGLAVNGATHTLMATIRRTSYF